MALKIADVNHIKAVTGWSTVVDGFILKATQWNNFVDSAFASRMAALRAAGRLRGSYHYAGPTGGAPPADPVVEADWYLAHYAHQDGEPIFLDFEPAVPPADRDVWCAAWHQRVIDRTGVAPLQYMNDGMARSVSWAKTRALIGSDRLWVARYFTNDGQLPTGRPSIGSWTGWTGWQYTSNGTVPGISGPVDLSTFPITPDQWRAYGSQGDDMPTADEIAAAVLDKLVPRQGGPTGDTSLAAVLSYFDGYMSLLGDVHGKVVDARYGLADRPGPDADDMLGQILSQRAELRALAAKVDAAGEPAAIATADVKAALLDPDVLKAIAKANNDDAAKRLQS